MIFMAVYPNIKRHIYASACMRQAGRAGKKKAPSGEEGRRPDGAWIEAAPRLRVPAGITEIYRENTVSVTTLAAFARFGTLAAQP
jgi:hypothetical protein